MDCHLDLPEPARELLTRIQRHGSPQALSTMTNPELARWTQTCSTMAARPGRANSAHRTWRQLLKHARTENAARHTANPPELANRSNLVTQSLLTGGNRSR